MATALNFDNAVLCNFFFEIGLLEDFEVGLEEDDRFDENLVLGLGLLSAAKCAKRLCRQTVPKVFGFVEKTLQLYSARDFKDDFRISKDSFHAIHQELHDHLVYLPRPNGRPPITPEKQLLISIWYLSNQDSMRGVARMFGVSKSSIHRCLHRVALAVVNILGKKFIRFPSHEEQEEISRDIEERTSLRGCIGFIDGTHIRLSSVPAGDTDYVNRKKFPSIQLQLIVDDKMRIRDTYVGWPGSCHDARVFRNSPIAAVVQDNGDAATIISPEKFIIGESEMILICIILHIMLCNVYSSK